MPPGDVYLRGNIERCPAKASRFTIILWRASCGQDKATPMTRKEIEQKMDELTDKYVETRNQKIIDELYKLTCELDELQKLEKQMKN
jgi:hypothetical protein